MKGSNLLNMLRYLQSTDRGVTKSMLAMRYHISIRTVNRYLKDFRLAGFNIIKEQYGRAHFMLYRIGEDNKDDGIQTEVSETRAPGEEEKEKQTAEEKG